MSEHRQEFENKLEEIESIDPKIVERIQLAVNSYYGQFEGSVENPVEAAKSAEPEAAPVPVESSEAETNGAEAESENESVTIENTEHPAVE